jgi:ComF family protein
MPIDHSLACEVCDFPNIEDSGCPDCKESQPCFDTLRSWAIYQGAIREAVHSLKFDGNIGLADTLASLLIDLFWKTGWEIDVVTAVPLSRRRQRIRGFNQSALLAQTVAWGIHKHFQKDAIHRTRETMTQVGLTAVERKNNVANAFFADPEIQNKRVLLIDDVATTGSTLSACANALKLSGASTVYCMTLARAVSLKMS